MGLITFNPATLKKSNYQPKVIFCSLHYSGEKESEPILHKDKVVIPANKRNLTINFASLDYQRKYQTRYLYRIDGLQLQACGYQTEAAIPSASTVSVMAITYSR